MGEKKLQVTLVFVILIKSRSCPNSWSISTQHVKQSRGGAAWRRFNTVTFNLAHRCDGHVWPAFVVISCMSSLPCLWNADGRCAPCALLISTTSKQELRFWARDEEKIRVAGHGPTFTNQWIITIELLVWQVVAWAQLVSMFCDRSNRTSCAEPLHLTVARQA
jgi:hypothetical protein